MRCCVCTTRLWDALLGSYMKTCKAVDGVKGAGHWHALLQVTRASSLDARDTGCSPQGESAECCGCGSPHSALAESCELRVLCPQDSQTKKDCWPEQGQPASSCCGMMGWAFGSD